jgi:hypothetical protein
MIAALPSPTPRPARRFGRWLMPLLGLALAAAGEPGPTPASGGDVVLLSSTAPGYAPGMVIAPHDRLLLPEGASATLLFRSGQMLRLRGPFEGTLDRPQPTSEAAAAPAIAELLRMQGVDTTVIGGTRSVALGIAPGRGLSGDVLVDPQHSGTYCLQAASQVWIARPAASGGPYELRRKGNLRGIAFAADAARIPWPDDVPIEDGDHFELLDNGAARATLVFRSLDERFASDAARIAAGILAGCHEQFDPGLRALARAGVPPELWLSSDRGRAPSYRSGEPVALTVQSDMDGYLYCVAVHGDGNAAPIFPTDAVDRGRLRASVPVAIPGRSVAGLRAGPKGTMQIRCWLADRDIGPELPHALLDPEAGRLPDRLAASLDDMFAVISGSRVLQAALTIRVE